MRPTRAEIDLGAVRHNTAVLARLIAPSSLCAVVKADGYGHGDAPVASAALEAGAGVLAVALVEEGIRLREAGIAAPVLLLSEPPPAAATEVVGWELTPTVYTVAFAEALARAGASIQIHVKVDTGMHRVGVLPEELPRLLRLLDSRLEVAAIWSHLPVADEDFAYTAGQIERFDQITSGLGVPYHLANTAAAVLFPEARGSMCRIGLGLYGLHPCPETRDLVDLRPAMRIVSEVSDVRRLPAGARPSYGRRRELVAEATVATVPIGYADGFPRHLADRGLVLIGGRRHPLAGMVTMDQIVVDLGDHEVERGDEVVVIGRQGADEITADEWATHLNTISYEVVCGIGPRVPRRYLE